MTLSTLDYNLIRAATDFTASSATVHAVVRFLAQDLIAIFPVVLLVLWRRPHLKGKVHSAEKATVMAVMSVVLGLAVKTGIAFVLLRARPLVSHPDLLSMNFIVEPDSFPSGHTMVSIAIAASLIFSGYRRLGRWLLIAGILIGISRIFAGVHYPSDIIGGIVLGIGAAWYIHREGSTLRRYLPNS